MVSLEPIAKYPQDAEFPEFIFKTNGTEVVAQKILGNPPSSIDYRIDLGGISSSSNSSSAEIVIGLLANRYIPVISNSCVCFEPLEPASISDRRALVVDCVDDVERGGEGVSYEIRHSEKREERLGFDLTSSSSSKRQRTISNGSGSEALFKTLVSKLPSLDQADLHQDQIKFYFILKLFEEALSSINGRAEELNIKRFSCFICFDFDDEHQKNLLEWVGGPLIQDLNLAGLTVWSSRNLVYGDSIPYFQGRIFYADKVILVCTKGGAEKIRSRMEEEGGTWRGIAAEMLMLLNSLENGRKGQSVIPIYEKGFTRKETCLFPLFLGSKGIKDLVPSITSERLSRLRQEAEDFDSPKQVFKVEHREKIPFGNALYYSTALKLYGTIRGLPPQLFSEIQQKFMEQAKEVLLRDTDFSDDEVKDIDDWKQRKEEGYWSQLRRNVRAIKHPELALADHLVNFYRSQQTTVYKVGGDRVWGIDFSIEGIYTNLVMTKKQEIERKGESQEASESKQRLTSEILFEPKETIPPENLFDNIVPSQRKRLIVFGVAGSGKTTFCQMAAVRQSQLWKEFKVVFFVRLRNLVHYVNGENIYQVLSRECEFDLIDYRTLFDDPKFKDQALLILDGYDELPSEGHLIHSQRLFREFEKTFPHLIVTSRPGFIDLSDTSEFELAGFNDTDISTYVEKFFQKSEELHVKSHPYTSEQYSKSLIELLDHQPTLKSLAQIPINLALVCTLFEEDEQLFRRSEDFTITTFYMEIVKTFFRRHLMRLVDLGRCKESISDIREQQTLRYHKKVASLARALERMAFQGINEGRVDINQNDIEKILGEENVYFGDLKKLGVLRIRHGDRGRGGGGEFIHQTFQEYFAAAHLAHLYLEGRTIKERRRLVEKGRKLLAQIKFNPRFQFTISLVAGYLSYQQNQLALQTFFDHLCAEPYDSARSYELRLFAQCFEECRNPAQINQYPKFIDECVSYIEKAPFAEMISELLNRNNKLFSSKKIVECLMLQFDNRFYVVNRALLLISRLQNFFPEPLISFLDSKAQDYELPSVHRTIIAETLVHVWKGAHQPNSIVKLVQNPIFTDINRLDWAKTLIDVIRSEESFPEEIKEALRDILTDSGLGRGLRSLVINHFETVIDEGVKLSDEVLIFLEQSIQIPKLEKEVKFCIAHVLLRMNRRGKTISEEAMKIALEIDQQSIEPQYLRGLSEIRERFSLESDENGDSSVKDDSESLAHDKEITTLKLMLDNSNVELTKEEIDSVKKTLDYYTSEFIDSSEKINPTFKQDINFLIDCYYQYFLMKKLLKFGKSFSKIASAKGKYSTFAMDCLEDMVQNIKLAPDMRLYMAQFLRPAIDLGGRPISSKTIVSLTGMISSQAIKPVTRVCTAEELCLMIKKSEEVSEELIHVLLEMVKENLKPFDKRITRVLGRFIKLREAISDSEKQTLLQMLRDPNADTHFKVLISESLIGVIEREKQYISDVAEAFLRMLENEKLDFFVQEEAFRVLVELVNVQNSLNVQGSLFQQTVLVLTDFVNRNSIGDAFLKNIQLRALGSMMFNQSGCELVIKICYLTFRPFSISNGRIHISDNNQQITFECPSEVNPDDLKTFNPYLDFVSKNIPLCASSSLEEK